MAISFRAVGALSLLLGVACGGSTRQAVDAGLSGGDAASTSDAGCVAKPVMGEACTIGVPACSPGNLCCEGEWICEGATSTWSLVLGSCACRPDAATTPDASTLLDAAVADALLPPAVCSAPAVAEAGEDLGCAAASCPSGTVCVQRDQDISSTATCVAIPASCGSQPTCACMGKQAQECAEPGSPLQTDATPSFLQCEDQTTGGAVYLDFPCGCA